MDCPIPPPIQTASSPFQNLCGAFTLCRVLSFCSPGGMLTEGTGVCKNAIMQKRDMPMKVNIVMRPVDWAYPKMKPAPKIRTMPGSSKDTLAVYMARNMAQPAQLF